MKGSNMAIGGITPKMKLAMKAYALLSISLKNGGITDGRYKFIKHFYPAVGELDNKGEGFINS